MKLSTQHLGIRGRRQPAFTMLEIAISLAVIGFALVAIIGVLPKGMNTQRENREDTIINQDGPYFLEAIRGGTGGLDDLTNYVDEIHVVTTNVLSGVTSIVTNYPISGSNIVGLLSLPQGRRFVPGNGEPIEKVEAFVRAMSGSAAGIANKDLVFRYLLTSEIAEITPSESFAPDSIETNTSVYAANSDEGILRKERLREAVNFPGNAFEIKLSLRWPLLPNGTVPNGRPTVFRTLAGGTFNNINDTNIGLMYFYIPQTFKRNLLTPP